MTGNSGTRARFAGSVTIAIRPKLSATIGSVAIVAAAVTASASMMAWAGPGGASGMRRSARAHPAIGPANATRPPVAARLS